MSIVNIRACYDLESALNYQELRNGIDRTACKCSNVEPNNFHELARQILPKIYYEFSDCFSFAKLFSF